MRLPLRSLGLLAAVVSMPPAFAATGSVSLNPFGAWRTDGASAQPGGFNGNLLLPANGSTPGLAFGFTVPPDYGTGPLKVVVLWNNPTDSACEFVLGSRFVYRARNGRAADGGTEAAGLAPSGASTAHATVLNGRGMAIGAPDPSGTTERMTFAIEPTQGQFAGPFKPGDAVNFGFARFDDHARDTCPGTVYVDSVSIEYTKAAP